MSTYKDFHELEIWKDGFSLLMQIYTISETFPSFEKYALTSQVIRSANGIIANIAESHGRFSYQDQIRVLYIARGEITETRSHLAVAFGQKYISTEKFTELNDGYVSLAKRLNAYISGIQKNKFQK